jgi:chromosomal replication initiation ATPase DnaA
MQILRECAKEYGCTVQEILSASRFANVINARHKAMWRLYQRGTMSLVQIGRYIKKDHATVLHAIRKHEKSLAQGEAK